jgi:ankyrin repeat protein
MSSTPNTDCTELLLKAGLDVNCVDHRGVPLLSLVILERRFDVARLLLDHNADIHRPDSDLFTPLMYATIANNADFIAYMLSHDPAPDPESRDSVGYTALALAAARGTLEATRALLEGRADARVVDRRGASPLVLTTNSECFRLLLDAGADANAKNLYGVPLLVQTCRGRRGRSQQPLGVEHVIERVELLLDVGADVDGVDYRGNTALLEAAAVGNTRLVEVLLERDANATVSNSVGATVLMAVVDPQCCRVRINFDEAALGEVVDPESLIDVFASIDDVAPSAVSADPAEDKRKEACLRVLLEHLMHYYQHLDDNLRLPV